MTSRAHLLVATATTTSLLFVHALPAEAVQFAAPTQVPFADGPRAVVLADLDRDGREDLVVADGQGVSVRRATSAPGQEPVAYGDAQRVLTRAGGMQDVGVADVDDDKDLDVVAAGPGVPGGSIVVLRNDSAPGTVRLAPEPGDAFGGANADQLAIADLNRDGAPDIAYVDRVEQRVFVLINTTGPTTPGTAGIDFTPAGPTGFAAGTAPVDLAAGELTGVEVATDLVVVGGGSFTVLRNTTASGSDVPSFVPGGSGTLGGTANAVASGELVEEPAGERPRSEFVIATTAGFNVLRETSGNTASPTYETKTGLGGGPLLDTTLANVDEAGAIDLIGLRADTGALSVAVTTGPGTYAAPSSHAAADDAPLSDGGVAAGEANGDGHPDIAVADGRDEVAVVLRTPEVTTSAGVLRYVEDTPPVVVDPGVNVQAPGGGRLVGATVRVSSGAPGDLLELPARNGISSSYDAGSRTLTLSGDAPAAAYVEALQDVRFSVPGDNPSTQPRRFAFSVDDGVRSPEATRDGEVVAVNDAPAVAFSGPSAFLPAAGQAQPVDDGLTVADPDTGSLQRATFRVAQGYRRGEDRLLMPARAGFNSSFDEERGTQTITSNRSLAEWQDALRSVTFSSTRGAEEARVITLTVVDAVGTPSAVAARTFATGPRGGVPRLSGTPAVGQVLTAEPGEWQGSGPITFGYQWQRCDAAGQSCADIPAATEQRYVVQPADAGSRLRAIVIADNPAPGDARAATPTSGVVPSTAGAGAGRLPGVGAAAGAVRLPRTFAITARGLRSGRIRLVVRAPRAGRLDLSRVRVGRTTRLSARRGTRLRAGTTVLTLRPTRAAIRLLQRRRALTFTMRATYRPTTGARVERVVRVTVRLPVVTARALSRGRLRLTIRAPRAGVVSLGRVRRGRTVVFDARRLRVRAGRQQVTLAPTSAGAALVRRRGTVALRVRSVYRPSKRGTGVRRETVRVTARRAAR